MFNATLKIDGVIVLSQSYPSETEADLAMNITFDNWVSQNVLPEDQNLYLKHGLCLDFVEARIERPK
tara:strand:+ start:511 stop:711 length:201 start_codon:yes stop_codon:yes gene_type:complete